MTTTERQQAELANLTNDQIKQAIKIAHDLRQSRTTSPEGRFDSAKRWEPSLVEDAGGDITRRLRSPSRAWPFSYMRGARTKRHVAVLVRRAIAGLPVPQDIACVLRYRVSAQ